MTPPVAVVEGDQVAGLRYLPPVFRHLPNLIRRIPVTAFRRHRRATAAPWNVLLALVALDETEGRHGRTRDKPGANC